MKKMSNDDEIRIVCPAWIRSGDWWHRRYASHDEMIALAIRLSRENLSAGKGGPFGAAVIDGSSGDLVSAGVNMVVPAGNSVLHAEIVALMMAQARLASHRLDRTGSGGRDLVLASSCDPCCMCLGAVINAGIGTLLAGADRDDAVRVGFDEGPVFEESWRYLEHAGISVKRGLRRKEAAAVLDDYLDAGGAIYVPGV